ncbi:hypothetical protein [Pseudomonas monteilii]|uniref:hypothetical protein n=1 Tax=Pseudomonas monteilii TaxID=76759 RepID=UPI001E4CE304|nr:hypothetical protein [Pseudomonas monteilii]
MRDMKARSMQDFSTLFISNFEKHIERLKIPEREYINGLRHRPLLAQIERASEIKAMLEDVFHHPETVLSQQRAERALLTFLDKRNADIGLLSFFHGWNETHKTTSLVSAKLIVRLSRDALYVNIAEQHMHNTVMAHMYEVAKDDLGLGHSGHDGMFPSMAAAFGAHGWENCQYSVDECSEFSEFLYRTGVAGHKLPVESDQYRYAVINAMMTAVASELWNGSEYNCLAQYINNKIIDMHPSLANDNVALRKANGYVMSHSGTVESRHGLHALAAVQKYHQLANLDFDLCKLKEKMIDYNQRVGKAFCSLHQALLQHGLGG